MPVLTGGQVLDREGTTVMPDWGGALLEGGLYNVGDHGLIEEAEEPVMGMGPYKYSGVPPNGYKNGIAEKGAYLVDILTGDTYRNTGTKAATVWTADAPSGGGSGPTERIYAWSGTMTIAPSGASVMDWSTATRQDHQGVPSGAPVGFTVDAGDHTKLLVTTAGLYYCLASLLVRGAITTQTELEVLSNFAYVLDETCVVPVSTNGRDFNFPLVQYFAAGAGIGVEVDNLGGQSVDLDLRMTFVRIGSVS
jgi:hypothetical protein